MVRKVKTFSIIAIVLFTLVFIVTTVSTTDLPITQLLSTHFKFDETSGNPKDFATGLHNGTAFSGVDYGYPGIKGTAYNFSSTSTSYVNISKANFDYSCVDLNCTVGFWVNKTANTGSDVVFWYGGEVPSNQRIQFTLSGGTSLDINYENDAAGQVTVNGGVNIINSEWQYFVGVFNGTSALLYHNGTLIQQKALTGSFTPGENMIIGQDPNLAGDGLNGQLDELKIWNRSLTASEIKFAYYNDLILIDLENPTDNTFNIDSEINFTATLLPRGVNSLNVTLWVWNSDGSVFNNSLTNIVNGTGQNITSFNMSTLDKNEYQWNVLGCFENFTTGANCVFSSSNNTLIYGIANISTELSSTIYETDRTHYNVSFNVSSGTPTGNLWFNGTKYTSTGSNIDGNTWRFSRSLTTPSAPTEPLGTKSVIWEIIQGSFRYNATQDTQTLSGANLTICGSSPQNVPYLNFTYKNETNNLEDVKAYVSSSTWYYWLSDSQTNKTLTYNTGTVESLSHAFCFSPAERTLNVDVSYNYKNSESQQRTYRLINGILTNSTTDITLYILPTLLGLYSRYQTITNIGNAVSGVLATVTKLIGSEAVTISTGTTDSSGLVIFFLNPDDTYSYTFSKSGYSDNTFSLNPNSADTYTVTMAKTTQGVNGSTLNLNTSYTILPKNYNLLNNTDYLFEFNYTSSQAIQTITMNLSTGNGTHLFFGSSTSNNITKTLNTANHTKIVGYFTANTTDETFEFSRVWIVGDFYDGDYSLFTQLTLFTGYGFNESIRILIVLAIIIGTTIFLSRTEVLDTSESKVAVVVLLVWAFSVISWLDIGLASTSSSSRIATLSSLSSQYGIAILTTVFGFIFISRRFLR